MNADGNSVNNEPDDYEKFVEFLLTAAFKATNDLRQHLQIDELNFRFAAPLSQNNSKDVYLYRVLDEIQKAGISIQLWREFLSNTKTENKISEQLERVAYESVIDDQSFRTRKLAEALVDLICFSQTNGEIFYRDFFLLKDLEGCVRAQQDREEFFAFKSQNAAFEIDLTKHEIEKMERSGLDSAKRWYLKKPQNFNLTWLENGVRFSSFKQRYKIAMSLCLPSEHTVLGKSYIHAYGMSKDVHFSAQDNSSDFNPEQARRGLDRVGLLCFALIIRCQIVMGIVPDGINKQLKEMHDSNTTPQSLIDDLKTEKFSSGDFVWAWGDLAEIITSKKSGYGFISYQICYLNRPPISSIKEDWFASGQIRKFLPRKRAEEILERMLSGSDFPEAERAHIISLIPKNRDEALRDVAKSAWKAHAAIKVAKKTEMPSGN